MLKLCGKIHLDITYTIYNFNVKKFLINTLNADMLNYFPTLSQSIIFAHLTRTALMTSFDDVACTGLTKIHCNLAGQYCVTVQPDMSVKKHMQLMIL
ncbi:hypothetical protein T11_1386 [Trichinella zimbabwensis]|uniref:Uncharacterized protein n=1 Tax=Trichinella zimbabwensis TaxID=268475 RepID=A0A0V1HI97_9BILA|nr:hypothetical protein T11_1386 [Trichinella zimbabwensis]